MFNTVITLICNPDAVKLDRALLDQVAQQLVTESEITPERKTLADDVAEDFLIFTQASLKTIEEIVRGPLGDAPIDVVVQPLAHRRKKLLIADMDSTIIEQECIDELAEYAGKRAEISDITERAMRGELDFDGALRARVAMLKGLPESVLQETFEKAITLTPGARALVQTMNVHGAVTALVSGGFTFFTGQVAAATGFQSNQANTLITKDGVLTGEVADPILGRAAKEEALHRLTSAHNISPEETLAVGDGANDLSMIGAAGLGVAFRAKPAVAAKAYARIEHADLTALLYAQGYIRSDFVD